MVVVPERGGVLLEGVGAGAGFAGDEPVFGVAVVVGGSLAPWRWVMVRTSGMSAAAAVEGVVDGQEVLGGEVVDPLIWRGSPLRASMSGARGPAP